MDLPAKDVCSMMAAQATAVLDSSGYQSDYSIESLADIDRFADELGEQLVPVGADGNINDPQARKLTLLLGCYVGEVLRRTYGGEWRADTDSHPLNWQVAFESGMVAHPVSKVVKRFVNGAEDGIHAFGLALAVFAHGVSDTEPKKRKSPRGKKRPNEAG